VPRGSAAPVDAVPETLTMVLEPEGAKFPVRVQAISVAVVDSREGGGTKRRRGWC
jgi:hypothetical protein